MPGNCGAAMRPAPRRRQRADLLGDRLALGRRPRVDEPLGVAPRALAPRLRRLEPGHLVERAGDVAEVRVVALLDLLLDAGDDAHVDLVDAVVVGLVARAVGGAHAHRRVGERQVVLGVRVREEEEVLHRARLALRRRVVEEPPRLGDRQPARVAAERLEVRVREVGDDEGHVALVGEEARRAAGEVGAQRLGDPQVRERGDDAVVARRGRARGTGGAACARRA